MFFNHKVFQSFIVGSLVMSLLISPAISFASPENSDFHYLSDEAIKTIKGLDEGVPFSVLRRQEPVEQTLILVGKIEVISTSLPEIVKWGREFFRLELLNTFTLLAGYAVVGGGYEKYGVPYESKYPNATWFAQVILFLSPLVYIVCDNFSGMRFDLYDKENYLLSMIFPVAKYKNKTQSNFISQQAQDALKDLHLSGEIPKEVVIRIDPAFFTQTQTSLIIAGYSRLTMKELLR